jgi:mannan endo-1,4-beta-mannosidase
LTTAKPLARVAVLLPAVAALVFIALASAGAFSSGSGHPGGSAAPTAPATHSPSPSPSPTPTVPPRTYKKVGGKRVCMTGCHFLGVAVQNRNALHPFIHATGVHPHIVQVYQRFGLSFPTSWAQEMTAHRYLPQVQINPFGTSLAGIAAGRYNGYLVSLAASLRQVNGPVVLSFGHEMNGTWYPWGCGHVSAATFVAAYQHVVRTIRHAGAHNVIWLWTASAAKSACRMGPWFPGDRYVTWAGVDGYLRTPGLDFPAVFGAAMKKLNSLSDRPILISETGVLVRTPKAGHRIADLYRNAASTPGVIGVVYFDSETEKFGDYRPQDNAAVLAAFKRATSRYVAAG